MERGSSAWGDIDNDGDLDLVVTGFDAGGNRTARIYENDGTGGFTDIGAGLTGVYSSSSEWGDIDNDGDLDLVVTGFDAGSNRTARIYANDGTGSFTELAGLPSAASSACPSGFERVGRH